MQHHKPKAKLGEYNGLSMVVQRHISWGSTGTNSKVYKNKLNNPKNWLQNGNELNQKPLSLLIQRRHNGITQC